MAARTADYRGMTWLLRRLAEVLIYLCALLSLWLAYDDFIPFESVFVTAAAFTVVYGLFMFYFPLSALLWFVAASKAKLGQRELVDSCFYVLHSYVAMSLTQHEWIGIDSNIDFYLPSIQAWLAVVGLHVILTAKSISARF